MLRFRSTWEFVSTLEKCREALGCASCYSTLIIALNVGTLSMNLSTRSAFYTELHWTKFVKPNGEREKDDNRSSNRSKHSKWNSQKHLILTMNLSWNDILQNIGGTRQFEKGTTCYKAFCKQWNTAMCRPTDVLSLMCCGMTTLLNSSSPGPSGYFTAGHVLCIWYDMAASKGRIRMRH